MEIHIPPPSKWNHKHIILVILIGTLVSIAITAIISISLSPAHISLSLTGMKVCGPVEDTKFYNFTLVASNRSPRLAVLYGALDAEIWYSQTAWVPAMVDLSVLQDGRRQAPGSVTHINVSAEYWQSEQASSNKEETPPSSGGVGSPPPPPPATGNANWSNCTVVVRAKVWFQAGWVGTRSYNIRASCSQVNFVGAAANATVNCKPG